MDETTLGDASSARPRRHGTAVRVGIALLALCIAAATVLAWALVSTHPAHARSGAPPKTSVRGGSGGSGRSGGSGGSGQGAKKSSTKASSTTTTTTPRVKTTTTTTVRIAGPVRVVEIGDSLGVDLGEAMQSTWPPSRVRLTMAARGDTGLSNSGYYDWPVVLEGLLASAHPEVVVVLLGANDLQNMVTGSKILDDGTPAWNAEYAARVTEIVSESVRAGADVLWIGEPAMQTSFINAGMTRIDGIAKKVTTEFPGRAAYLDANAVLAPKGSFTFDVTGPTGQQVQVRTPDGVHLMPAGAELLAAAAAKALASTWGMHVVAP